MSKGGKRTCHGALYSTWSSKPIPLVSHRHTVALRPLDVLLAVCAYWRWIATVYFPESLRVLLGRELLLLCSSRAPTSCCDIAAASCSADVCPSAAGAPAVRLAPDGPPCRCALVCWDGPIGCCKRSRSCFCNGSCRRRNTSSRVSSELSPPSSSSSLGF